MPLILMPADELITKLKITEGGPIHAYLTEECYKAMDKFTPYREGDLKSNVELRPGKIIYNEPYAKYMYYGKKMVMSNGKSAFYSPDYGFWSKKGEKKTLTNEDLVYHTPGTGPYWDKRMWSAKKQDVIKKTQDFLNRGGK